MSNPFGTEDLLTRDQWGRPLIQPPGGGQAVPYTRASTLAGALKDGNGLIKWKARHVALGIARHRDLAAMAAPLEYGDKALDDIIETACDRVGLNAKANYGTAVHSFTERPETVGYADDEMAADAAAYQAVMDAAGIRAVAAEQFVVNDELRCAGTLDHVYEVPTALVPGGEALPGKTARVVGDKKTGSLHFYEHAAQLAVYATGALYDPATHTRTPLDVSTSWALLAHIPRGEAKCILYWVDIANGRTIAEAARDVMEIRKDGMVAQAVAAVIAPAPPKAKRAAKAKPAAAPAPEPPAKAPDDVEERRTKLAEAIGQAVSETALTALWKARRDIWTDEHTVLAKATRALIQGGMR